MTIYCASKCLSLLRSAKMHDAAAGLPGYCKAPFRIFIVFLLVAGELSGCMAELLRAYSVRDADYSPCSYSRFVVRIILIR